MHAAPLLENSRSPLSPVPNTANSTLGLSVVIPCYNEVEGIQNLQARLAEWATQVEPELTWEVVFVDDGSTDLTADEIGRVFGGSHCFRILRHKANRGLAAALVTGFEGSRGRWIACLDADCTYDPIILNELLVKAKSGFDVVTASPYFEQGRVENVAAWRIMLSRTASRMYRVLMKEKLSCYTCCVRIYDAGLLKSCPQICSPGFVGVTELLWHLDRRGARIGEVAAVLRPRHTGVSKMRTMRTMLRHFRLMLRIIFSGKRR